MEALGETNIDILHAHIIETTEILSHHNNDSVLLAANSIMGISVMHLASAITNSRQILTGVEWSETTTPFHEEESPDSPIDPVD
jgi:hypothetical protein